MARKIIRCIRAGTPPRHCGDRASCLIGLRHGGPAMTRAMELELLDSKKKMVSGTYLRNAWYVAAWSDNLADGQLLSRTILKEPIVLFRKSDGHIAALQDRCPHRFAPLHMGKIVGGDRVQCPYHGLEFDSSGACVLNPHGTKNIPPRARVRSYPVTEKHKAVWIWMGEQSPDLAKVPDFSVLDNVPEMHASKRDRITIRANYELIIDNLLDLAIRPICTTEFSAMRIRSNPKSPSSRSATTSSSAVTPAMRPRRDYSPF